MLAVLAKLVTFRYDCDVFTSKEYSRIVQVVSP